MKKYFDLLDWDTGFFGYRIVSLDLNGLREKRLEEIIPELRNERSQACLLFY